jgi:hypothetical protein
MRNLPTRCTSTDAPLTASSQPAVSALSGSLGDLIMRAEGRPIYCTAPLAVHPALIAAVVGSFRRDFPRAEFVAARGLYRDTDDWRRRWQSECKHYGAGIVVTRGEGRPKSADPFAGLAGEHVVGIGVGLEIERLARLGRPVGWHAVVFPAAYWLARFAVEPFFEIQASRYARLLRAPAEPFRPIIGRWPPSDTDDS